MEIWKTIGKLSVLASALLLAIGCESPPAELSPVYGKSQGALENTQVLLVTVTLDGEPAVDVPIEQGGKTERWRTNELGQATVLVDGDVLGDVFVMASHPEARVRGTYVSEGDTEATILLERYPLEDNEEYTYKEPGEYGNAIVIWECGHCHTTINKDYSESAHSRSASNPVLYDVYQGRRSGELSAASCEAAGGEWLLIATPDGGEPAEQCVVETSVQDLGTDGACANCHAPGINGKIGGHDLMEAEGAAYEYGVHCDVCHRVESLDLEGEPGVGGFLKLLRPSDKPFSVQLGDWAPLTFGPNGNNVNGNMGSVERPFYHESEFCAGCHQQDQPVWAGDGAIDLTRWPSGKLPVHSTYAEWEAGPMNPAAPCQSCHMPPNPQVSNSADLQNVAAIVAGVVGGWVRPPGSTRRHTWPGPRTEGGNMLALAAAVFVEKDVSDGVVTASVRVKNVGPGHAIPTGEPMRSMVLVVEAACGEEALVPIGGDVIPDFGGAYGMKGPEEDWLEWPDALPGQVLRVVNRSGEALDYVGYGPFGDGSFSAEEKGMEREEYVGEATIVSVEDGAVTLDSELPEGDRVYWVDPLSFPEDKDGVQARAGAPGFAFARVMVGADGRRMVPHYLAVDVASDNRLLPQQEWTSTHLFSTSCEDPEVRAVLVHRAYPFSLALERGWSLLERIMTGGKR